MCELIFEKTHFPGKYLVIKHLPLIARNSIISYRKSMEFGIQERATSKRVRYKILLTSCTKWQNGERLKISI